MIFNSRRIRILALFFFEALEVRLKSSECSQRPSAMLIRRMPVVDIYTKGSTNVPFCVPDLLQGISISVTMTANMLLHLSKQLTCSGIQAEPFRKWVIWFALPGRFVQDCDGQLKIVHDLFLLIA